MGKSPLDMAYITIMVTRSQDHALSEYGLVSEAVSVVDLCRFAQS